LRWYQGDGINISIDNLQHFASFKRIDDLKEERDRGFFLLKSFSIADYFSNELAEVQKGFNSQSATDDFNLLDNNIEVDVDEFEDARSRGMFKGLSINENESNQLLNEEDKLNEDNDDEDNLRL